MARRRTIEIGFPFQLDTRGQAADPGYERHVREMIEQLLFTRPGERVNRPDFGCGLLELVFSPDTAEDASVTERLARASLQRYLGDVATVTALVVEARDTTLDIRVEYELPGIEERQVATFELRDLPWHI